MEGSAPIKPGDSITLTGYPGEKNGVMYSMTGTVDEITQIPGTNSFLINYVDIDTTPGQSGAIIVTTNSRGTFACGVHVMGSKSSNFGTLIDTDLCNWIKTS